ncbi:MAG: hypothetical protein INQ03_13295 [Candidatus Heimdallarchaeota archaeon]|nr:hypothetical protein [Candidatus Heimdallarchaeota archaeon]
MKCDLCLEEIKNYSDVLNRFEISNDREIHICKVCVNKFMDWQREIHAKLFPTKTVKRMQEGKKKKRT